ncbi:MAG: M50 family metallopeptidase [Chloroflexaceae bacterium]|nr:M50 family metallopeptidase [Chloroflexaceae bacterium]
MIGWIFYPFHLFGTFIHELSHGLAAILTGGEFRRFRVDYDLSGRAWSAGGIGWIISSAGYVGSALFGGFLMIITAHAVSARTVLALLGVALGVLCLIFVRNWFGIFSGLAIAGLLILAAERLNATWAYGLLLFLSVQMMLNALDSVFGLVWISSSRADVLTDARNMQLMTGIPALFWALLWSAISLTVLIIAVSVAFRRNSLYGVQ